MCFGSSPDAARPTLEPDCLPVASGIARREVAVVESPDRLAAPELVVVVNHDQFMAALPQPVQRARAESILHADLQPLEPPEPWTVTGCLRVLAVVGDPHHHLHMALWLHRAAHHAEAHQRRAVLRHEAGNDCVVRTLSRPNLIWMPCRRHETNAAVLQRDP